MFLRSLQGARGFPVYMHISASCRLIGSVIDTTFGLGVFGIDEVTILLYNGRFNSCTKLKTFPKGFIDYQWVVWEEFIVSVGTALTASCARWRDRRIRCVRRGVYFRLERAVRNRGRVRISLWTRRCALVVLHPVYRHVIVSIRRQILMRNGWLN